MSGKSVTFRIKLPQTVEALPQIWISMFYISKDNPCYFFTCVTNNRLPVFRTEKLKEVAGKAINEARKSSEILIFAYVLMPDHFHIITDSKLKSSGVLRYLNGVTARRVIDYLKEKDLAVSLEKLKKFEKKTRLQIFAVGASFGYFYNHVRINVYAESELYSSEPRAGRFGREYG